MAKRRAEALAFRAPFQRFAPHAPLPKRPRGHLEPRCAALWLEGGGGGGDRAGGSCKKRKREGMEGRDGGREEEAASNGKRRAVAEESGPPKEKRPGFEGGTTAPWPPKQERSAGGKAAASAGDLATQKVSQENEDDVWRYNSFQYWRSPLPTINLSDILDLENSDTVDERDSSSIGLSEMET